VKFWNQYPLLRVLIPLIAGVLTNWYAGFIQYSWIWLLLSFFMLLIWVFKPQSFNNYKFRFIGGGLTVVVFFLLGYVLTEFHQQQNNENHYSKYENISHFLVRMDAPFTATPKSQKTIGKVLAIKTSSDSLLKAAHGKLLLYFKKSDTLVLKYGDELIIGAKNLSPIKNMGNPNEFDYEAYLSRLQIYHQLYLIETDWLKTGKHSVNLILKWSYNVREQLIYLLQSFKFSDHNFAVASAILLGYDEYLDQDLRQLYAGSGAMHILCVSGLHVGIIFLIFNVILSPLNTRRSLKITKTLIIVVLIWFYALITGLSPSVFRAATMFSFISFGQIMDRKTSVYNSLSASAIVLIVYDPLVIFHIGFQLSYSAILGILLIQPLISSLWKVKNIILKYFWDLFAVSIAAQMGTFPLSIYYFHQFPNYFILTNLFVIPWSFLVLVSGFITLAIELLGLGAVIVFSYSKVILEFLLTTLNAGIDLIHQIPYSVSQALFFTAIDVWLIYLFIALFFASFLLKKIRYLYTGLICFAILMIWNGVIRTQAATKKTESLTIYHIPGNALAEFQKGNHSIIIMDSSLFEQGNYSRYISEHMLSKRIKKEETFILNSEDYNQSILQLGSWKTFILGKKNLLPEETKKVDILWLRNNPKIKPQLVLDKIQTDIVVYDASNAYWKAEIWKSYCDSLDIAFHDIKKKGAYITMAPLDK
jgi:competence protein ComEC